MKYSASFKLQVVKFASDNSNNSAASRKFGIDKKSVRDWRRKIDNIKSLRITIGLLPNSGRNSSVKAMMKKNSMAFEEKQTNKQTAPLGATKYEKRNDQCFIVLKLALELSKYRYRGYLFVFKIYCSNFILEFQIICLFYLTDAN